MRPLEAAIVLALLPAVLGLFVSAQRRPRWLRHLPWLGLALIALHLALEGYRWQMVPAYVLTGIFLLVALRSSTLPAADPPPAPPVSRWRRVGKMAGAVAMLLVFGLTALLPALLPVFELPAPSGAARVGTTSFSLVDASRPETFTPDESDRRELLIQVWYPAEPAADSKPERLWSHPREIAGRLTRDVGLPGFAFDHFTLVETHSHRDAALSDARSTYPVLLFSHGYGQGIPPQNTVQMEALASHGYIVFSIGHSYESLALIHPDGRIVAVDKDQVQRVRKQLSGSGPLIKRILASQDAEERQRLLQQINEDNAYLADSVRIWSADTSLLLDELAKLDGIKQPRRFAGRLDLARVGVFGMSFGGAVAADVCLKDSRCRAGINLDGLQFGAAALPDSGLKLPFMFMASAVNGRMNEPVFRRAQADAWYVTVDGSNHLNFTDFSLISPLFRMIGVLGPIEGARMEEIMNAYILAFFDRNLAGRDSPLLKAESADYPEVSVQTRTRQVAP